MFLHPASLALLIPELSLLISWLWRNCCQMPRSPAIQVSLERFLTPPCIVPLSPQHAVGLGKRIGKVRLVLWGVEAVQGGQSPEAAREEGKTWPAIQPIFAWL